MKKLLWFAVAFLLFASATQAQGYEFKDIVELKYTPVKNQQRAGTCWSYSGLSFLESELLRLGKGEYDFSELFIVRHCYSDKAEKFVRLHGHLNFSGGGAFHDVLYVMKNYGLVPEAVYEGKNYGETQHVHGEVDAVLKNYVKAVIENKNKRLSTAWHSGFEGILDAYFGTLPEKFTHKGKQYTPKSFAASTGLNPDDYVQVSSYTHHPFYQTFPIEVPDNWLWGEVHNVKLDEMMKIIDNSLENGYTVGWASDVSEKGFSFRNDLAIVPETDVKELAGSERLKWEKMDESERRKQMYSFEKPVPEKKITQEMRQKQFDNYRTTDDHGMHFVGIAEDQNGTKYYKVKNSWGTESNPMKGFFYASKPFVALKTMSIMVHKDAIPNDIRKKLGL